MDNRLVIDTLDKLQKHITLHNLGYLVGSVAVARLVQLSYPPVKSLFSPLRTLPGPETERFLWGNLKQVLSSSNLVIYDEWAAKYGTTFAYQGLLSSYRLVTLDIRALSFIMSESDSFPKPDNFRQGLAGFVGQGLLFVELDAHKRQRRIMNPSFGSPHIRALLPIFWEKSIKLKDALLSLSKSSTEGGDVVDVLPWISRATLDIVGAAGFDYHFNSLENDEKDELSAAFRKAFQSGQSAGALAILQRFVPAFRSIIPDERARAQAQASAIMRRIGAKLVSEKKTLLNHELKTGSTAHGRDLLTLLIKSNMASESEGQMMTDDEVLAQISTFLFAGHETTSTSTSWALYALTQHTEVQFKLRQELLDSGLGDEPGMADLEKLSYLDAVVHETLRLYPAVPATVREAAHDMHVPTSRSYTDRIGKERDHIVLQKGDVIVIPIVAMNRNKEIWGEDAMEFRPERWEDLPEAAKTMPGVWGHLMTFIQGSRSCIGYRFAIAEMKCLLYTLVRAIEFKIDPNIKLEYKSLSARPLVVSHSEQGNQMPLSCKPVLSI